MSRQAEFLAKSRSEPEPEPVSRASDPAGAVRLLANFAKLHSANLRILQLVERRCFGFAARDPFREIGIRCDLGLDPGHAILASEAVIGDFDLRAGHAVDGEQEQEFHSSRTRTSSAPHAARMMKPMKMNIFEVLQNRTRPIFRTGFGNEARFGKGRGFNSSNFEPSRA